jgi:hypothetical protein
VLLIKRIRAMEELNTADAKKIASAVVTGMVAEADAEAIAEPEGEANGEADGEAGEAKPAVEEQPAPEQAEQAPAARMPTTAAKRNEQTSTKKS